MTSGNLFTALPDGIEPILRDLNPWWQDKPMATLPAMRRVAFTQIMQHLATGMTPALALRGPRQVGKSTLQSQAIDALLKQGTPRKHIFRVQFDELAALEHLESPVLDLTRWYAEYVLGQTFAEAQQVGGPVYIFLDEIQNLDNWAPQLKHLVDTHRVRVMVTGSSALRIEAGRDSLAGRITTLDLGPLLLREIATIQGFGDLPFFQSLNGYGPLKQKAFWSDLATYGHQHARIRDRAFAAFSQRGAYPVAHVNASQPWNDVASLLTETVVKRAIVHDLRMGSRGQRRDQTLLEEVFRLACRYAGQSPGSALYLNEVRQSMNANIGWQRINNYLRFLDGALLLRLIEPLELRLKKRRGAAKLCLCDHALRAAWLQEDIALDPEALSARPADAVLAGHIAESAAGYFLASNTNLQVAHFPERGAEPEVDFVLTIGEQRIPIEIKYRKRVGFDDTHGLRSFLDKAHYHAPFGVLVTQTDAPQLDDPRIVCLPLSSLLLMR